MLISAQHDFRTGQTYRTTSAFGSNERKQHTTQQPHQHDIRFQAADKTSPMYRTTHPPTDQAIHPRTNPPTMLSQYSSKRMHCFMLELRQSRPVIQRREQNTAVAPKTTTAPPPTGTKALTHARNDRHPPTQPTARQPTNPSYHQTLQPTCATAVQQYSSAYQQVRTPANRGDWSVLDFLS